MYNHAPQNYVCPICLGVQGVENEQTLIRASDIIYQDQTVTVFIASYWIGKNSGHVIVVPNQHIEHLYDLPDELGAAIVATARRMAIAMKKAYVCDGITLQQNNEPAGGQHAFHYHLHLFPRYEGDDIYAHLKNKRETTVEERLPYAEKMRQAL